MTSTLDDDPSLIRCILQSLANVLIGMRHVFLWKVDVVRFETSLAQSVHPLLELPAGYFKTSDDVSGQLTKQPVVNYITTPPPLHAVGSRQKSVGRNLKPLNSSLLGAGRSVTWVPKCRPVTP